uniref:exodeoxyribonuclease III n=1 Tax=Astatotilapia calliptera TaxID=8154 RepID=A0AAX7UTV9_ASTCA
MQGEPVELISFNVNGVLNPVKRSKILSKLKREKAQVAFLQETHLSQSEHVKLRRQGFKNVFLSSYMAGHRRGVAILISNTINNEHISELQDGEGRFIKITGKIEGQEMTFINVYIPGSNWTIYKQIFDLMVNSQGLVICGGDFNIRLNPKLDVSG